MPKLRRKLPNGVRHALTHFSPREAFLGIIVPGGKVTSHGVIQCSGRLVQREELSVAPFADEINRGVRADARYPGMEIVSFFIARSRARKLLEPSDHLQAGFLAHILGICRVPRQAQ